MLAEGGLDLMVVIGGYNSSNTQALARICAERLPTYHISAADRIEREAIRHRPVGAHDETATAGLAARGADHHRPDRGGLDAQQRGGRGRRADPRPARPAGRRPRRGLSYGLASPIGPASGAVREHGQLAVERGVQSAERAELLRRRRGHVPEGATVTGLARPRVIVPLGSWRFHVAGGQARPRPGDREQAVDRVGHRPGRAPRGGAPGGDLPGRAPARERAGARRSSCGTR